MIEAIAIGMPARDEQDRIADAVLALDAAAREVALPVHLAILADSCTDATAARASIALVGASAFATAEVHEAVLGTAGAARDRACAAALARCASRHPIGATWLATTDADTTVPARWLARQLAWEARGADGVAGLVDLADGDGLSRRAQRRWRELVDRAGIGIDHPHVHGANLGMRADVWLAAGGFAHRAVGEDHELWRRARQIGARLVGAPDIVVRTSARTTGRAPGGLAALLAAFELK